MPPGQKLYIAEWAMLIASILLFLPYESLQNGPGASWYMTLVIPVIFVLLIGSRLLQFIRYWGPQRYRFRPSLWSSFFPSSPREQETEPVYDAQPRRFGYKVGSSSRSVSVSDLVLMAALLGGGFVLINDAGGHVSNRVWLEVVLLLGLVAWRIVMGDSKSRPTFHRKHRRNGSYEPDEIEAAPDYALMIQDQEWREEQRRQSRYKRKHKHPN